MSSLFNKKIKDTFQGVLHVNAEELPDTGQVPVFDGLGNKSALSLGKEGAGAKVSAPFTVNNLEYPSDTAGTTTGSIMIQLSSNKLGFKDVSELFLDFVNLLYPINSVILTTDNINPGSRLAGTKWIQVSKGEVVAGVGSGDFVVGDNLGSYTRSVAVPDHYHGIGQFKKETNNDLHVIIARDDTRLPATGWIDNNNTYWVRQNNGDGTGRGQDTQVSDGATKTRAAITTKPFAYTGGALSPSVDIDIKPPAYGVYVWKRTE